MLITTALHGVQIMRAIILLLTGFMLSACGGGGSNGGNTTAPVNICQRSDINAQVYCALQQDYLWYRDLPASINPDNYASPEALLQAVAAPQDRYSFILTAEEYQDRYINATFFGFGFILSRDKTYPSNSITTTHEMICIHYLSSLHLTV